MDFAGINIFSVLLAGFAGFATGAIWYTVLSKQWIKAVGLTPEETKPKPFLLINALICQGVMAFVLAGVIGHLGTGNINLKNGLISAFFVFFGFVLTTQLVNHRFQKKPWSLTLIDCGHWLAVLFIQGAIIGLIGV